MGEFDYMLRVKNDSGETRDFAVFQKAPKQDKSIQSLAWFVKTIHDNPAMDPAADSAAFKWNEDYSFVWSETGELNDQVHFEASDAWPADTSAVKTSSTRKKAGDQVGFDKEGGAYTFQQVDRPNDVQKGQLLVKCGGNTEKKKTSIGLAMYGSPFFAVQAEPNFNWIFAPEPEYWIVATKLVKGDAISAVGMSNAYKIDFSLSNDVTVTYDGQNRFSQQR
ncbi:hypothetical protein [Kitasatospora sp. NPDC001175]|uniref:hypothetical protein n=1 Tax=Kitasatospora sp. NPDC001175 TaxID=3157103 RepID=UPI003D019930